LPRKPREVNRATGVAAQLRGRPPDFGGGMQQLFA
jgi:hypothetical protein